MKSEMGITKYYKRTLRKWVQWLTLLLGFMPLLSRYGMVKMDFFEKPTSLAIGALWPPLLSHLARWNEINAEIRSRCEYLDFMKNVSHHDDIVRIIGYVETSET